MTGKGSDNGFRLLPPYRSRRRIFRCGLHAQNRRPAQLREIVVRLSLCIEPVHIRKWEIVHSILEGIELLEDRAIQRDRSHGTLGNCICCLCQTRAEMGPHGGFELWRCSIDGSHNFSSYIHAGIVVIALLGCCYAEPNVKPPELRQKCLSGLDRRRRENPAGKSAPVFFPPCTMLKVVCPSSGRVEGRGTF